MPVAGERVGRDAADRSCARRRSTAPPGTRSPPRPAVLRRQGARGARARPRARRARPDPDLAATVVAAGRDLEPQRQPDRHRRRPRRSSVVRTSRQGATATPARLEEPPLGDPVLGHVQRQPAGTDRPERVDRVDDLGRDVFELVGHDVAPPGQAQRRHRRRRSRRRPRRSAIAGRADTPGSGSRTATR